MQTMQVGTTPPTGLPVAAERLHRITLEQYDRLIATGFFGRSDRVVLLDGLLVDKMTKADRHSVAVTDCYRLISSLLPAGWHVRQEQPVAIPDGPEGHDSKPEPDIAVVVGAKPRRYLRRTPHPGDVALLIQIAGSSLALDRKALARYGWVRIPVVWIVNLTNDTVEIYSDPSGPGAVSGYGKSEFKGIHDTLTFLLPGRDGGDPVGPIGPIIAADLLALGDEAEEEGVS